MNYNYHSFHWLASMDGFNYPIDVTYGTTYLGTLEAKPNGFVIQRIDTPKGTKAVLQSSNNIFKSQDLAAKVLHKTWKSLRQGTINN